MPGQWQWTSGLRAAVWEPGHSSIAPAAEHPGKVLALFHKWGLPLISVRLAITALCGFKALSIFFSAVPALPETRECKVCSFQITTKLTAVAACVRYLLMCDPRSVLCWWGPHFHLFSFSFYLFHFYDFLFSYWGMNSECLHWDTSWSYFLIFYFETVACWVAELPRIKLVISLPQLPKVLRL